MTAPTLTITISQSGDDLVLSGSLDENELGITRYAPPALQQRQSFMPTSADIHGDEAVSQSWQQSLLSFDWVPDTADDETDVAAAYAAVVAAISQFAFTVTTKVSDAAAEVWSANGGSIVLAGTSRDYPDLAHYNPVYTVTIPVYPIAS